MFDAFKGKFPVDKAHANIPVGGIGRLVYNQQVAVVDTVAFHAVPLYPRVEGRFRVFDKAFVQVYAFLDEVLRLSKLKYNQKPKDKITISDSISE